MFVIGNVSTDVYMKVVFPKLPTGEEVMSVSDMKVDFRMSNVRVHLDNLFNGNKVLGEKYLNTVLGPCRGILDGFISVWVKISGTLIRLVICINQVTNTFVLNRLRRFHGLQLAYFTGSAFGVRFGILSSSFKEFEVEILLLNGGK